MFSRILWVAEALRSQPPFYDRFCSLMEHIGVRTGSIRGATNNIWCRDFMPLATAHGTLVQFRYWPDYLVRSPRYRNTIVDAEQLAVESSVPRVNSDLIVDGGNVVLGPDYAVLTSKVLRENPHYRRRKLIAELQRLLGVDRIIFIPQDPHDFTGHADGMVSAYSHDTVLVNDHRHAVPDQGTRIRRVLRAMGLGCETVPYTPQALGKAGSAVGCYINHLCHSQCVVVPLFGLPEDELAMRRFEELYPYHDVSGLPCREIALQGGALHCITWATRPVWMSIAERNKQTGPSTWRSSGQARRRYAPA